MAHNPVTSNSIWTGSGYLDFRAPHKATFRVADIARGLSRRARFSGHTIGEEPLSVARHSICVMHMARRLDLSRDLERVALLHDAAEAFLVDLPTPAKSLPELAGYCEIEDRLQDAIFAAFGLTAAARDWRRTVDGLDRAALAVERAALIDDPHPWPGCPGVDDTDNPHVRPESAQRDAQVFCVFATELGLPASAPVVRVGA